MYVNNVCRAVMNINCLRGVTVHVEAPDKSMQPEMKEERERQSGLDYFACDKRCHSIHCNPPFSPFFPYTLSISTHKHACDSTFQVTRSHVENLPPSFLPSCSSSSSAAATVVVCCSPPDVQPQTFFHHISQH